MFDQYVDCRNSNKSLVTVFYRDGHPCAYTSNVKISYIHSTQMKLEVPATEGARISACQGQYTLAGLFHGVGLSPTVTNKEKVT